MACFLTARMTRTTERSCKRRFKRCFKRRYAVYCRVSGLPSFHSLLYSGTPRWSSQKPRRSVTYSAGNDPQANADMRGRGSSGGADRPPVSPCVFGVTGVVCCRSGAPLWPVSLSNNCSRWQRASCHISLLPWALV